jgi:hypothetical protein
MEVLRYGDLGAEESARLDDDGLIRSFAGVVMDVDADVLSPDSTARWSLGLSALPALDGDVLYSSGAANLSFGQGLAQRAP